MKSLLLLLFFAMPLFMYGQTESIGFSIGYNSSRSADLDINYRKNKNRFHIGGTLGQGGAKGKKVKERLPNYGGTIIGNGDYITTFDIGYSRYFTKKINVKADFSVGTRNHYNNYRDGRFSGGGYHYVYEKEAIVGAGLYAGYCFTNWFEIYGGYSTLRKVGGGLRFNLAI